MNGPHKNIWAAGSPRVILSAGASSLATANYYLKVATTCTYDMHCVMQELINLDDFEEFQRKRGLRKPKEDQKVTIHVLKCINFDKFIAS